MTAHGAKRPVMDMSAPGGGKTGSHQRRGKSTRLTLNGPEEDSAVTLIIPALCLDVQ
jgi:hypothetical protein